jgi:hypothetical protein
MPSGCIMIVIFTTCALNKTPRESRLIGSNSADATLALHIVVRPELVEARGTLSGYVRFLSAQIIRGLPLRPLRKPKSLDYDRVRAALVACMHPLATNAA